MTRADHGASSSDRYSRLRLYATSSALSLRPPFSHMRKQLSRLPA